MLRSSLALQAALRKSGVISWADLDWRTGSWGADPTPHIHPNASYAWRPTIEQFHDGHVWSEMVCPMCDTRRQSGSLLRVSDSRTRTTTIHPCHRCGLGSNGEVV